jgi:tetratricopeptide (TPR) repeat protein
LAYALVQLGRDDEAVALFRKAIQEIPAFAPAWRGLTAALAMADRLEEAQQALERTMELDPAFSLKSITVRLGFSEEVRRGRLFEGWRRAGVQETQSETGAPTLA